MSNPMPSPTPAGYYGLQLSEDVEAEIEALDFKKLTHLISEVSQSIQFDINHVAFQNVSDEFDSVFDDLGERGRIAILRWLSDRLASLANSRITA